MQPELQAQGAPPFWTSYVDVVDADETTTKAKELGAVVIRGAFDVFTLGRMSVIQDPTGAVFATWQAGEHHGAQLVNEPGALAWNELMTRDLDGSKSFYSDLFGWECNTAQMGSMTYTEIKNAGQPNGGMMEIMEHMGPIPPNWMVYFATADCDATVAKAIELGGSITVGATDIPRDVSPYCRIPKVGRSASSRSIPSPKADCVRRPVHRACGAQTLSSYEA